MKCPLKFDTVDLAYSFAQQMVARHAHTRFSLRSWKSSTEIKSIEDLVALAQYQSFSRAAEVRNVTQSGCSRRIQPLEQWVAADLIDRSRYPPTLTPAGHDPCW
jgi:hypothetical protein